MLLENTVVRIAARLLDLRTVDFLILRGRVLRRVLVLLHVGHLRLLVHRISCRGSRRAYGLRLRVKRRAGIAAAASLVGLLLMMRLWLLMQGCLGLWLCMLVRVAHRGA